MVIMVRIIGTSPYTTMVTRNKHIVELQQWLSQVKCSQTDQ